jgi:acyl-CoA reductase-like NAD-dependent aldehyde dehydrogenase
MGTSRPPGRYNPGMPGRYNPGMTEAVRPSENQMAGSDSWALEAEYPLWIGGRSVPSTTRREVRSPYDGRLVGYVFEAGEAEAAAAVAAARDAFPSMKAMSRHERASLLRRAATLLAEQRELFAHTISAESAKPLRESRVEVERGIATLGFSADEALRLSGEVVPMDAAPNGKGYVGFTVREPLGVVAAITPFNFPLNLSLHKIGPAIAAGNTVVHKPASTTPLTAMLLARLFDEAGLPAGALNTIPGPGSAVGKALTTHPDVRMITFTGSAEVGIGIRERAAMRRVTLELGSNSAVVVLADADLALAAQRCVAGSYAHSGQVCISVQRIFVEQAIAEDFCQQFVEQVSALRQGAPEHEDTQVSCLISAGEAQRVAAWIREAKDEGAALLCGGKEAEGARLAPTVLRGVPQQSRLMRCEAFGPVVCINTVGSLDEAITAVNVSDYGLQAGVFTRDVGSAWKAAQEIHTGAVLINETPQFRVDQMPYGGVKQSGTGREGPHYAIAEMTESKLIVWKLG